MMKFLFAALCLLNCSVYGIQSVSTFTPPEQPLVSGLGDLVEILESTQEFIQPISPPGSDIYIDQKRYPYPVDWSGFDSQVTKYMTAYMDEYGLPRYELLVWEDVKTREKVVSLVNTGLEVARIPAKPEYSPDLFYQTTLLNGAACSEEMRWIFDPAHTAVSIELIPQSLYTAYRQNEAAQMLSMQMEPMTMSMGPPPPDGSSGGTGTVEFVSGSGTNSSIVSMTSDSNSVVTMTITVPESFGGQHIEIFGKDNLLYSPAWQIEKSWLPTFGNPTVAWTDPDTGSKDVCYYIISDADDDADGDGYSRLRELIFESGGNGPDVFDHKDSDADGMHDWHEIKLFGDLAQSGSGDFDGDLLLNSEEMVYNSNTASIVWNSDPSLADSDGDNMDDYFETVLYGFLDPLNKDSRDIDGDGLDNTVEHSLGFALDDYDTDDDGLSDGYEHKYGLSVLVPDDLSSDLDGDNLTLEIEYKYDTNPGVKDTDGDLVDDDIEVAQNSSPTSAADGGQPPAAGDTLDVIIGLGDNYGSASEQFEMVITGDKTVRITSGEQGSSWKKETNTFTKGVSYTMKINLKEHFGGSAASTYLASVITSRGLIVEDPDSMLGIKTVDPDISATMHIVKITVEGADYIGEINDRDIYASAVQQDPVKISLGVTPLDGESAGVDWTGGLPGEHDCERYVSASSLTDNNQYITANKPGPALLNHRHMVFPAKPTPVTTTPEVDLEFSSSVPLDTGWFGGFAYGDAKNRATYEYTVYYENKKWKAELTGADCTYRYRTDDQGREGITDGAVNPFPLSPIIDQNSTEDECRVRAVQDFTPDAVGIPTQGAYWAPVLVDDHERYHYTDWTGNFYGTMIAQAEAAFEQIKKDVTTGLWLDYDYVENKFADDMITQCAPNAFDAVKAGYLNDAEGKAYADGKAGFQALADTIEANRGQ